MSQLKIREMPQEERPREKVARARGIALTDPELIAILLRTGVPGANAIEVARELLESIRSLRGLSRCASGIEENPGHRTSQSRAAGRGISISGIVSRARRYRSRRSIRPNS